MILVNLNIKLKVLQELCFENKFKITLSHSFDAVPRRQKAKARRSREMDMMSDFENMECY